jgi:outer membrane murein-binding lipoprotein Lpp
VRSWTLLTVSFCAYARATPLRGCGLTWLGGLTEEREWAMEKWTPSVASDETLEDVPLSRWIGEAIGAASMCWLWNGQRISVGVFDSVEAKRISDALCDHVQSVIDGVIEGTIKAERKGDPREVGWAARKIDELTRRVAQLNESVAHLQHKTENWVDHGDEIREGSDDLDRRVVQLESGIASMSDQVNADRDRLNEAHGRISDIQNNYVTETGFEDLIGRIRKLERRVNAYGVPVVGSSDTMELAKRIKDVERFIQHQQGLDPDDEFSPPVGGITPDKAQAVFDDGFKRGANEGFRSGQSDGTAQAKRMVREYMQGHFSEATIQGVMRAITGDKPINTIVRDGDPGALHGSTEVKIERDKVERFVK